jgi:hypothetical protein
MMGNHMTYEIVPVSCITAVRGGHWSNGSFGARLLTHGELWAIITDHPDATEVGGAFMGFASPITGEPGRQECLAWLATRGFVEETEGKS